MAFVVIYDACVLYPAQLRDLLVRIANTGIVRAWWSSLALTSALVTRYPTAERLTLREDALRHHHVDSDVPVHELRDAQVRRDARQPIGVGLRQAA